MRTWDLGELEKSIAGKKEEVEKKILQSKSDDRLVRRRARDEDEQKILDAICLKKWRNAEKEGKIKYLSKNEWYYEIR